MAAQPSEAGRPGTPGKKNGGRSLGTPSRVLIIAVGAVALGALLAVVLIGGAGTGEEKRERVGTSDQPTGGPAAEGQAGRPAGNGKVNILLPRLRKVSGIEALTAECRDISYRSRGSAVEVKVKYPSTGVVSAAVFPAPGNGTGMQSKTQAMSRKRPEHTFVFRYVPGKIHHVQVSVTTKTGADQCYARKA